MVTREEVKEELSKRGVNSKLLDMPAVLERVLPLLKDADYKEMQTKLDSILTVSKNGDFSFATGYSLKTSFEAKEDEKVVIVGSPYEDSEIHVNKYGIEEQYYDGDWMGRFTQIRRQDGKIIVGSGNNGTGMLEESTYLDNGSWSIQSHGAKLDDKTQIDEDEVLKQFDDKAGDVLPFYPETRTWYEETRAQVVEVMRVQNDPQEIIKRLIEENEKLKREKKELLTSMEGQTIKFSRALDFIDTVKSHPLGKVFFGKPLKQFEKSYLPKGKDEEKEK